MASSTSILEFTDENPVQKGNSSKAVILFGAVWHESCVSGGVMDQLLIELAAAETTSSGIAFGRVDVDRSPALAQTYQVMAVPTFVLLNQAGTIVESVVGGEDAEAVKAAVHRLVTNTTSSESIVLNKFSRYVRAVHGETAFLDILIYAYHIQSVVLRNPRLSGAVS